MSAPAVVTSAQGAGTSKSITTPTAGNLMVVFASQGGTSAPTITDSAGGSYTLGASNALYATSASSLYVGFKWAAGTETSVSCTTAAGLVYFEVSGANNPSIIEQIKPINNGAFQSLSTTSAITTEQTDLILAAVALTASQSPTTWSGTKVMTMVSTAGTPLFGGYYQATGPLSAQTFTGNWSGSRNHCNLVIAIEPVYTPPSNAAGILRML
jgi:hypothetical protein